MGRIAVKAVRDFFLCRVGECFAYASKGAGVSNGVNCGERLGSVRFREHCLRGLKGPPILFSRNVIARADKAEHICNTLRFVGFGFHFGKLIVKNL